MKVTKPTRAFCGPECGGSGGGSDCFNAGGWKQIVTCLT